MDLESDDGSQPLPPAVVVHGLADARSARACGRPVTLLSAEAAALSGGVMWWQAVVAEARAAYPATRSFDILDCGNAPGAAMAALRAGQRLLVLTTDTPAWARVAQAARTLGARILPARPPALDMASPAARRQLEAYLGAGDSQADADTPR